MIVAVFILRRNIADVAGSPQNRGTLPLFPASHYPTYPAHLSESAKSVPAS